MSANSPSRQPLRIAFCITELDVGGAEQCLVNLACGLDRARFEPAVFVLGPRPPSPRDSLYCRLAAADVPVKSLGARASWQAVPALYRLTRELRAFRPEVLQTFLWHANVLGRIAARLARVPHVVSGIRVAERRSRWPLLLDRWTESLVDRHVAVSQGVAEFSQVVGGLAVQTIAVIGNGVDLARFPAPPADLSALGVPPGAPVLLFVGRLDPQKRLDWLLRLLPPLFVELPRWHLVVAGDGSERQVYEKLATELGLAQRVHFAGFRSDVPALLAASELLVLPSAWEGMPNVVLEAMAAGRPVVATEVEGIVELLGQGTDEQMTPVDDPSQFAQRLLAIMRDPELRQRLGATNRQRAEQFSLARMIERYAALFDELSADC